MGVKVAGRGIGKKGVFFFFFLSTLKKKKQQSRGRDLRLQTNGDFLTRRKRFPGMFAIDSFFIPIILLLCINLC